MAGKNKAPKASMKNELRLMESPVDSEFEAFKAIAKERLEEAFDDENLGEPTETDLKFLKIMFDKIKGEFEEKSLVDRKLLLFKLLLSGCDCQEFFDVAFKRYSEIMAKSLTRKFKAKYHLTDKKLDAILESAICIALSKCVEIFEDEDKALESDDIEYGKIAGLGAFMEDHMENLELAFELNKLEPPTISDYALLETLIRRFSEGASNSRVVIPRSLAESTLKKIALKYANLFEEALDLECILENNFTNERMVTIAEYAAHQTFDQFIMEDKDFENLTIDKIHKETLERDPSMMYA